MINKRSDNICSFHLFAVMAKIDPVKEETAKKNKRHTIYGDAEKSETSLRILTFTFVFF